MLEGFEAALRMGRRRAAYGAALEAWRARRAPELAALVERTAKRFSSSASPPSGRTQKAWVEAWVAHARRRAPFETAWLMAQLDEAARAHRGSQVAVCLDELADVADDPSVTTAACALAGVSGGAVNFGSWGKVLTRLFALVERSGDPRAIGLFEALLADAAANPELRGTSTSASLVERIPKVIARLRSRLTENVPLDPAEAAEVRAAQTLLDGPLPDPAEEEGAAPSAEESLYAAVLADPDDDRARAMWADALQQRGDPRGELIALQLAAATGDNPKAAKAAARLVKAHWREWLGPLAPVVEPSTVELDRGLLDACHTDVGRKSVADAIFSHPSWATVRRLTFSGYGALTAEMRRLEVAVNVPESGLEALATIALPRLRALSVRPSAWRGTEVVGRGLKVLAGARGLPSLKELRLWLFIERDPEEYRWVFAAPFGAQLELFAISADWTGWAEEALVPWVALFREAAPSLRRFEVRATNSLLVISLADRTGTATFGGGARDSHGNPMPWVLRERAAARALVEAAGFRWTEN